MTRRDELAAFLRARATRCAPTESGCPRDDRDGRKGLRREEIAMLAGVSVTWYTWLEQGRPINASVDVLYALARALRLDDAERQHLLTLATARAAGADRDRRARSRCARAADHVDGAGAGVRARAALGLPRLEPRRNRCCTR